MASIKPEIRHRIAERIVRGPFGRHVNFQLVHLDVDSCTVRLPFHASVANGVGVVHGGAISALVDTSAVGAAWASPRHGERTRGATVGLTVSYLEPGLRSDLLGTARVVRRGRSICTIEVDVKDEGGRHVARGLVTYRLREAGAAEVEGPSVLGSEADASPA